MKTHSESRTKIAILAFLIAAVFLFPSGALAAADGYGITAQSASELTPVTLTSGSSYLTQSFFAASQITSTDQRVATACADSSGRVVVTGIAQGTSTIRFYTKTKQGAGWVLNTLTVTVNSVIPGSAPAQTEDSHTKETENEHTLTLPYQTWALTVGDEETLTNLLRSGEEVAANKLLWVTADSGVLGVGTYTGLCRGRREGTTTLYAIDPVTGAMASILVTVVSS